VSAVAAEAAVVVPAPRKPSGSSATTAARPRKVSAAAKARRREARFAPFSGVLPPVHVPEAEQTLATTRSRLAGCGFSWMQATHWFVGSGCYVAAPGDRVQAMNATTLRLAQELAALSPCRPSTRYLAKRLGVSVRTVKYHLEALRQAGLLAYVEKGGLRAGIGGWASEYALVIPTAYDDALGIRTVGKGTARRAVGIEDAGRSLVTKLAKKAVRKVRAAAAKPAAKGAKNTAAQVSPKAPEGRSADRPGGVVGAVDGGPDADARCTAMESATGGFSSATTHVSPPDKLASGKNDHAPGTHHSPAPAGKAKAKTKRRFELAGELINRVPWLAKARQRGVAWVSQHVADAGWTCEEVVAWLDAVGDPPATGLRSPSGLLEFRLKGVTGLPGWRTPAKRAVEVEHWRDSRRAARARHADHVWDGGVWQLPRDPQTAAAFEQARRLVQQAAVVVHHADDQPVALEDLTREDVIALRGLALEHLDKGDPSPVLGMVADRGEEFARRLFTSRVVDWARTIDTAGLGGGAW
jgi:DNA-binding transcriptional ArsR family regulator